MIAAVVAFPLAAFTLAAFFDRRTVRTILRAGAALLAVIATVLILPSLAWLSAVFAVMISLLCSASHFRFADSILFLSLFIIFEQLR